MLKHTISKLAILSIIIFQVTSCSKESTEPSPSTPTPNPPIVKKLKRINTAFSGTTRAFIEDFVYDANGRLTEYNYRLEDSATTPVQILSSTNSSLYYVGSNVYPIKTIIRLTNGDIDSTLYYYDSQARSIREEHYHLGIMNIKTEFNYLSSQLITRSQFQETGSGIGLFLYDSIYIDAQNKVIEGKEYNIPSGSGLYTNYTYDLKKNPFSNIEAFKHIFSFFVTDRRYNYRAPNNIIDYQANAIGSTYTMNFNYNNYLYDSANYPISYNLHKESTNPTNTEDTKVIFSYY